MPVLDEKTWKALGPTLQRRLLNSLLPPLDTTATEPGQRALPEPEDDSTPEAQP